MELIARHSRTQKMTCHVTSDVVAGTGKAAELSSKIFCQSRQIQALNETYPG